ncbi:MAG: class I SAM-dependent methyltransferase [Candidatus Paceibacterota bacterium]
MFSNPQKILLQTGISKGTIIADLGCGVGYYSVLVAHMVGDQGLVYSIDINPDLISKTAKEAKDEGLKNIRPIVGDIEKKGGTSLADESVDLCLMTNAMFALENKKEAIEEAKRITKKKGRILFVEWSDSFGGIGPHSEHVFKESEALEMFLLAGFEMVQKIDAGEHHYGIIWRKA